MVKNFIDRVIKHKIIIFLILFMIVLVMGRNIRLETIDVKEAFLQKNDTIESGEMTEILYQKDAVTARHPNYISGGSDKQIQDWNNIINSDFNKILQIYSFHPIPGPTPAKEEPIPDILTMEYLIENNDKNLLSIYYLAKFNARYSAHPTQLVYTTNLNKVDSSRFKLENAVYITPSFVKNIRTWNIRTKEGESEELKKATTDYLASISEEDLSRGLMAADQIGAKNHWDIYSYYTDGKIGISIGAPNYLGDHIEIEQDYDKILEYLKPDFQKLIGIK